MPKIEKIQAPIRGDGLAARSERPTLIGKLGSWLLIIPSVLIGIILVELFCELFIPSLVNPSGLDRRVVFLDGRAPIFENHGDIFTYLPHAEFRQLVGFFSDYDFYVEFDYRYRTNNYGLVQDGDIEPGRESLILLGDSFTEGQGVEPWFRLVSPLIEKLGYQPVNGGLLGTGFQQWLELDRYLSAKDIQIGKVVVLFISDDYHRPVWNMPPPLLACLTALSRCRAEQSYFYRLPPATEMSSWIAKVRTARGPARIRLKMRASALLPASYSIYRHFRQQMVFAKAEGGSHAAIAELTRLYGPENIVFIHLPQKNEIGHGPDDLGLKARRAIEDAGARWYDGFNLCQMTTSDYHANDEHPNQSGYRKIAACTANVIDELLSRARRGG
ncbi:MAG: hypothetical protein WA459_14430 [Stellaceae bacterium]